ncbi:MAG: HINT domain-containing protein, partial [Planctomycetes bacterium]|nr:HINT domain-containing protein [Planctomycetota bacterium]
GGAKVPITPDIISRPFREMLETDLANLRQMSRTETSRLTEDAKTANAWQLGHTDASQFSEDSSNQFYQTLAIQGTTMLAAAVFLNPGLYACGGIMQLAVRGVNIVLGVSASIDAVQNFYNGNYGRFVLDAVAARYAFRAGMARPGGLIGCFAAGTHVRTPEGSRPIEQIRFGDLVLAASEHEPDGEVRPRQVLQTMRRLSAIFLLKVGGQEIRTTSEHPFWVKDKGWLKTTELNSGDLVRSHDGCWIEIEGWTDTGEFDNVYNFEVESDHTYFIGEDCWWFSVWSHNSELCLTGSAPATSARVPPTTVPGVAADRVAHFNRAGYQNYRLETNVGTPENPVWRIHYHGYIAPGKTAAAITRRHAGTVGPDGLARFNPATDRIVIEPGTRLYGEARLMETRRITQDGTNIGRVDVSGSRRGNNQGGLDPAKLPEYEAWEQALHGR